jgi:5-methylthioadenosine/S-adenosylhomocysteine deaminase
MSILIKNSTIITQNSKRSIIKGDLYIEDSNIAQISESPISIEADCLIDGRKKIVLPGLINTHTHVPMTILRGYGDDMPLNEWLEERIWPIETKLTNESVKPAALLGMLEMIASGTTTFLDMYFFENAIAEVTQKAGLRGMLGFGLIDFGTPEVKPEELFPECIKFIKKWHNHDLINPLIAPHATYTCGPETLIKTAELSKKYNVMVHMHCSETRDEIYQIEKKYGNRPIEQINKCGLLNSKLSLAHCGWITKNEIYEMSKASVKACHCPVSNMKIGTGGYAPVPEMIESNVTVSLGTDGAASNNSLDMFDTMKFCSLVHKQHRWDPKIIPAQTVLDFATINGAITIGKEENIGSIEIGKNADLIMIDLNKPHLIPCHDPVSHLVYAAKGSDVCTTIVNGKPLMIDYNFLNLDSQKIMNDAEKVAKDLTNNV